MMIKIESNANTNNQVKQISASKNQQQSNTHQVSSDQLKAFDFHEQESFSIYEDAPEEEVKHEAKIEVPWKVFKEEQPEETSEAQVEVKNEMVDQMCQANLISLSKGPAYSRKVSDLKLPPPPSSSTMISTVAKERTEIRQSDIQNKYLELSIWIQPAKDLLRSQIFSFNSSFIIEELQGALDRNFFHKKNEFGLEVIYKGVLRAEILSSSLPLHSTKTCFHISHYVDKDNTLKISVHVFSSVIFSFVEDVCRD